MKRAILYLLPLALLISERTVAAPAEDPPYTEYKRKSTRELQFKLIFDKQNIGYEIQEEETTSEFSFSRSDLHIERGRATVSDVALFEDDALILSGRRFKLDEITDTRVMTDDGSTVVAFYTRSEGSRSYERIRRGNIVRPTERIAVEDADFVRGMVLTATGDIEVYGEVNKDVISLFGDVFIGPDAVVRGDVVSMTGNVEVARDASVYGEIHSRLDKRKGRSYRFRRRLDELSVSGTMYYNRVDGFHPSMTLKYQDGDSLLPSLWLTGGYAFESKRWRYEVGLEQTVFRKPVLAVGGRAFRRLASDDDWFLSENENTPFAFFFTEDWKDYYESEGGHGYIKFQPVTNLNFNLGYLNEKTRWFKGQPLLWSLFGGDKKFRSNFSSVDLETRAIGMAEIDETTNARIIGEVNFDTRDKSDPYDYSAWLVKGTIEWSRPGLNSDFDYTRYRLAVARYQQIHRRTMVMLRGMFGDADGYLPMHQRFYLGGLGTIHGYRHKEYYGDHFWMTNLEYRWSFPRSGLAASIFWDMGQITTGSTFDGAEVKHGLGLGVYLGDDLKLMLTRRLDRGNDNDPVFYARFSLPW